MPDTEGEKKVDEKDVPKSSLHAYKEGRPEDVEGDPTAKDVLEEPVEERQDPEKH